MFRLLSLLCLTAFPALCLAQTPYRSPWHVLAPKSSVVIVGTVESTVIVVHPEKGGGIEILPDGQQRVRLPDYDEYIAGHIYKLRVDEVIKGDGKVMLEDTVSVFAPGFFRMHESPGLIDKEQFLIFLSPFQFNPKDYAGTVIHQFDPASKTAKESRFDPRGRYSVVEKSNGAVQITLEAQTLVDEVKAAIAYPPPK